MDNFFCKLMIILGAFTIVGCAQWRIPKHPQSTVEEQPIINSIAIMPFKKVQNKEARRDGSGSCPICESLFMSGEVVSNAEEKLTGLFFQKLRYSRTYSILPIGQVTGVISKELHDDLKASYFKIAVQVGKGLNVDGVLIGFVFRYQDRQGNAYSIKRPASVAFEVHLISVKESRSIWKGTFVETQKSLSENVLKLPSFIKRGSRWLTADELAEHGVDEVLKKFLKRRR